jgi:hypothetical protein
MQNFKLWERLHPKSNHGLKWINDKAFSIGFNLIPFTYKINHKSTHFMFSFEMLKLLGKIKGVLSYTQKFTKKWVFLIWKPSCPLKAWCHLKLNVSSWWPLFLKGYVGGWYVISFRFVQSTNLHYNLYRKHSNYGHENFLSLNCPHFHAFL